MANERVYQAWKGSNIFLCNGRLVFGPDARSLIVSVLLILVPSVIFCNFVALNLLHKFPSYNAGYWILVVTIIFTVYVLVLLIFTSARDPGIIPRNSHPPEEEFCYESASAEGGGKPTPSLQFPRTKEVLVNGFPVRVKYCETCMLYRPPRCSHCSICNNCVEKFDHHCPWVGQCIGMRNYRFFFMFISSATLLCIFVFAMSAVYMKFLVDDHHNVLKAIKESPASVVLMAYCFIALWFVGGLTGFHLYLISTNQTTYENFRYRADHRPNAFNRGCANNFLEVFCTKIQPSKNKFRSLVQEEPPRVTTRSTPETAGHSGVDRRAKVEEDLEIGDEILKLSQRRDYYGASEDITRGNDGFARESVESDFKSSSEMQDPLSRTESLQPRRKGSFGTSPHILAFNDIVADSRRA
ncbi:protein S-acyltransferase 8-like [Silene latifolia]|uniref:protein S-acyltransferase 8-like n=1 Tax=Silene latifolia TaxID=37657 RepID=UPI003D773DB6